MKYLITGCARSGTSLTSRVLDACGLNFGEVYELHENTAIRDGLVKPFLTSIGADPLGQSPLPETIPFVDVGWWRQEVGRRLGQADTYKGAKVCLIWPVWHAAYPDAKWIIVRRDRDDIISSCMRTSFMRAFDDREGWSTWVDAHLPRFREIQQNCDVVEVWPFRGRDVDVDALRKLVKQLGLTWDDQAVADAIAYKSP